MTTTTYKNWIAKTRECGFTNEQACGLAMLYAWTLTRRESADDLPDTESFWTFVDKDEFDQLNKSAFSVDDFVRFVPEFKLAGELLRVPMPLERTDSSGMPAALLNLQWDAGPEIGPTVDEVLLLRHRFDMLWCQRVGECLQEEIKTPKHAFVFAEYVTHGFIKFDPEGFTRILNGLLDKKSPFSSVFSSKSLVKQLNGFEGYEPFQIALLGFSSGQLGELVWNLQRVLFYKQTDGTLINIDKQYLASSLFLEFAAPVITNFINIHRNSYLNSGLLIASEYDLANAGESQPFDQLVETMEKRYGILLSPDSESKSLNLLANVAAF